MKLAKEKREIEVAEQYALIAKFPGIYNCFTCPSKTIYLLPGNVWKHGVTRKEEAIRYGLTNLSNANLYYKTQFVGNYAACLIEEKIKLYYYPLLPENMTRPDTLRLIYPPGNTQDK